MPPTGEQIQRLQNALLAGYTFDDLRQMVRIGLDAELEHIVPTQDRTLIQIVYALIRWAAAQDGGFVRLAQVALVSNSSNPHLQMWVADYAALDFAVLPLPGAITDQPDAPRAPLPFATVAVAAGPFRMGSVPAAGIPPYETPQFELVLASFRIGKYLVTNEHYAAYVRATRQLVGPDLEWDGQTVPAAKRTHPVAGVTWYEAVAYCQWLSAQTGIRCLLPTEAQWEKATRGTDARLYPWGDAWEEGRSHHGGTGTAPVDGRADQSPYGCCDMVGHVRQWTRSLWGERLQAPDEAYRYPWATDATPADASDIVRRVWRGASYADAKAHLRCAARGALFPSRSGPPGLRMGFRVVVEL